MQSHPLVNLDIGDVGATDWNDKPLAIVGGGLSAGGFDFGRLKPGFRVLAINASIFDCQADAGFSLDRIAMTRWWHQWAGLPVPIYLAVPSGRERFPGQPGPNFRFVRRVQKQTYTKDLAHISAGGTSGFGALHLAMLKGAKHVVLLGFDYGSSGGAWHHNEQRYAGFRASQDHLKWQMWADNFSLVVPQLQEAGMQVINASPCSAISAFRKMTIEEALRL